MDPLVLTLLSITVVRLVVLVEQKNVKRVVAAVAEIEIDDHKRETYDGISDLQEWLANGLGIPLAKFVDTLARPYMEHNTQSAVVMKCINRENPEPKEFRKQLKTKNDGKKKNRFINETLPVAILIHGWRFTESKWMMEMANDYIKYNDVNVCMIYWESLAWGTDLIRIIDRSIPRATKLISGFIQTLNEYHGIELDDISLIGHGLAAHLASFVSNQFDNQIGAIYALDPMGPLFTEPVQDEYEYRLDRRDAKYIQAIYTSSNALGSDTMMGHQNFRPNLGRYPQFPCRFRKTELAYVCSHEIVIDYFRYALNPENVFAARRCDRNLTNYLMDNCKTKFYDRMGIHADREKPGVYYFEPSKNPPYVPYTLETDNGY
ncbi:lipase member H-like [Culicoides brevitarsis]|uniref:lipase member H-like n=1 Tax=Culicoides brevitarsis TaxID=469753 RepID=UPI00307C5332